MLLGHPVATDDYLLDTEMTCAEDGTITLRESTLFSSVTKLGQCKMTFSVLPTSS
jgi:hypothetical protein